VRIHTSTHTPTQRETLKERKWEIESRIEYRNVGPKREVLTESIIVIAPDIECRARINQVENFTQQKNSKEIQAK